MTTTVLVLMRRKRTGSTDYPVKEILRTFAGRLAIVVTAAIEVAAATEPSIA